ncbi:MAG: leucyl aminopeptidase family protein [Myxococcota bacterium]
MPAQLTFAASAADLQGVDALLVVGRAARLVQPDVLALLPAGLPEPLFRQMVRKTEPGDHGRVATTWLDGAPSRLHVGVLPEACSRHNAPSRAWAIPAMVSAASKGNLGVVLALEHADHAAASALAVARALPTFSATSSTVERQARVLLLAPGDQALPDLARLDLAAEAVRRAAHETDEPPDRLGCDALVERARAVGAAVGATVTVLRRDALRDQGCGGLFGVGRAAAQEPALVILDHAPADAARTVAWVGKGIVYDTGGLSLKTKTSMPGMKTDKAGALAVLAAFEAAARAGAPDRIVAALCIAENAVGPEAIRPDDVLTMFSGKTVEVNNTDAEGRLVLSDGVAWVVRHFSPDVLIDLATLTGAQAVATGKRHAAVYCSDEALEAEAVRVGRRTGDLVHPVPYAPELLRAEFRSPVADMRNSVKDRSNAQPSCAGQFIGNHLAAVGYDKPWLHVDMAAPAVSSSGRGTGYGVGLLLGLAGLL